MSLLSALGEGGSITARCPERPCDVINLQGASLCEPRHAAVRWLEVRKSCRKEPSGAFFDGSMKSFTTLRLP